MRNLTIVVSLLVVGCSTESAQRDAQGPDPCEDFNKSRAVDPKKHVETFGCPPCPCSCYQGNIQCASCPPCDSFSPPEDSIEAKIAAWDQPKDRPVGDGVVSRDMFVVADVASVCPYREQAETNACGHSVESADEGLRYRRGERVAVVGDEPVDGYWRAIRFTKMGRLTGWVAADRVALAPDLTHVDAFRQQHPKAVVVRSDKLSVAVRATSPEDPDSVVPHEPTVFLTEIEGQKTALVTGDCFGVQREEFVPFAWSHHGCLQNADCGELDYVCAADGFCDEVTFVLADRKPYVVDGVKVPAKTVTALADRVGVFENVKNCRK